MLSSKLAGNIYVILIISYECLKMVAPTKINVGEIMEVCRKKHSVSPADIRNIFAGKLMHPRSTQCMFHCIYEKLGIMTENGRYISKNIVSVSRSCYANEPLKVLKFVDLAERCGDRVNKIASGFDTRFGKCSAAHLFYTCLTFYGTEKGFPSYENMQRIFTEEHPN